MNRPDFDAILDTAWRDAGYCMCPLHHREEYHGKSTGAIETPEWSFAKACDRFDIKILGEYPKGEYPQDGERGCSGEKGDERIIWIRPNVPDRVPVAAHELAHILLGHTKLKPLMNRALRGGSLTRRLYDAMDNQSEAEAESTSLLVTSSLTMADAKVSTLAQRRYIAKHWPGPLPVDSRERVKRAAQQILSAGALDIALAA